MRLWYGIPTLFIICLTFTQCKDSLPVYGEREYDPELNDSVYHQVGEFAFINQNREIVTVDSLKGKITIVNFFFTSCPSICPIMVDQLKNLQKRTDGIYNIQILSHTVDPETDTVERLQHFIERNKINTKNWNFVTGDKQDLYESGVYNYYLATSEDVLAPGGFLHSEKFVLIDKDLHIRGFYDGTEEEEVNKLIKDLELLTNE